METILHDRYHLLKPLGEGGFAKTYLAEDRQQGDLRCVIKHLTLANPNPQALKTARRLFQSEVAVLRRVGTHDRIPELIDAFEIDGEFYLVQEFIDGIPLAEHFQQKGPYTEAEIVQLLQDVLPILVFIHSQQVIHRDLKPTNLMVRQADQKPVLIDFGAVKEITTQITPEQSEQFTISIGTQGYAAPEQMAGRPRYSSDLYGLGMTVIRGLTGRSPTELPENPVTGELLWQEVVPDVSPGLAALLKRLTHVSVYQRYPSAQDALADLDRLETLADDTAEDLVETVLNPAISSRSLPPPLPPLLRWLRWGRTAIAPVIVTSLALLIRQFGGWVPLELWLYDQWVRYQPPRPPDNRLLLLEITETDLQNLQRPTPDDATLSQAIQTLQTFSPRVIGLDLYRDLPQGEGHSELLQSLAAENVIAIRKLGTSPTDAVPAPASVPPERVGINDVPFDNDGVIRRALLFASPSDQPDSPAVYAFSLQMALAYLAQEGIVPQPSDLNPNWMSLSNTTLPPLTRHFGGYRAMDNRGYQMLLRYPYRPQSFHRLNLTDVLSGNFDGDRVRDRIVVIGMTAPSARDLFQTLFSANNQDPDFQTPGVLLHLYATSQLLNLALDGEKPLWDIPETAEIGWVILAGLGGSLLSSSCRRRWLWGGGLLVGTGTTIALPLTALALGGWIPAVPATIAFVGTALGTSLLQPSTQPRSTSKTHESTWVEVQTVTPDKTIQ
jgi:CHASE2 domain-containing sensor protein